MTLWRRYDIRKYSADAILFREIKCKLEDLKVLKRSPDLFNNVKIGQCQHRLIIQTYIVSPYMGSGHFDQATLKNIIFILFYLLNTPYEILVQTAC